MDTEKQQIAELLEAELLDKGRKPDADISLLQARILKTAMQTPQDSPLVRAPYINIENWNIAGWNIAGWKSIAATLMLTTGIGFGLGQVDNENTAYASAEALLSMSLVNDYDETGLGQSPEQMPEPKSEQSLTGEQP